MIECAYGDNRTLLMLSVTLLKLFLSEDAQSWCGDVYHITVSDFRLTNELSSTRPNSIDDAFGTIANGKLCVLVLVNISLQVFLNDSQHISDDFGLFLQITTVGQPLSFQNSTIGERI